MTYLIDTDVMVDFFKHKEQATTLLSRLSKSSILIVSAITIAELRSGWTNEEAEFFMPRLYALCTVMSVTKEIAEQAGKWRQEHRKKGVSLGTPDTLIAATAYLSGYTLITNNAKDYPMHEVTLFKHEEEVG